jgi:hypothetical protein
MALLCLVQALTHCLAEPLAWFCSFPGKSSVLIGLVSEFLNRVKREKCWKLKGINSQPASLALHVWLQATCVEPCQASVACDSVGELGTED